MPSAPRCWPVTRRLPTCPGDGSDHPLTIPTGRARAPPFPGRYRQTRDQCCSLPLINVHGASSKAWEDHGCGPGLVPMSESALFPGPTGPRPLVQGRPPPQHSGCVGPAAVLVRTQSQPWGRLCQWGRPSDCGWTCQMMLQERRGPLGRGGLSQPSGGHVCEAGVLASCSVQALEASVGQLGAWLRQRGWRAQPSPVSQPGRCLLPPPPPPGCVNWPFPAGPALCCPLLAMQAGAPPLGMERVVSFVKRPGRQSCAWQSHAARGCPSRQGNQGIVTNLIKFAL